mgnify:CR=1 FL=1
MPIKGDNECPNILNAICRKEVNQRIKRQLTNSMLNKSDVIRFRDIFKSSYNKEKSVKS